MRNLILLFISLATFTIYAAAPSHSLDDLRGERKVGVEVGYLGAPYGEEMGFGLGYHALPFLKVHALLGGTRDVYGRGVGTIAIGPSLLIPEWSFSPSLGFLWGTSFWGGPFAPRHDRFYFTAGFDWLTRMGLSLSAGLNIEARLRRSVLSDASPYLRLGFYF